MALRLGQSNTGGSGAGSSPIGASFDAWYAAQLYADNGMPRAFSDMHTIARLSTKYAQDSLGNYTSFGNNVPAITDLGILIEESRTNSIRNNSMQGAVAGTVIGTAVNPTNWVASLAPTGVVGTQALATVNGIDFISQNLSGTPVATAALWQFDGNTVIAATPGQVWTASSFIQLLGGSLISGFTGFDLALREHDVGGAFLRQTLISIQSADATVKRFSNTVTLGASTAFVVAGIRANYNGTAAAFNLGIGWPQLELGAFATSPIRTTGSAATRAADVITAPSRFASFTQTSIYIEWLELEGPVTLGHFLTTILSDSSNRIRLLVENTNKVKFDLSSGGVSQTVINSVNSVTAPQTYKTAARWLLNDVANFSSPILGADQPVDTSATMPLGALTIGIGQNGFGATQLNGFIKRLTFYPRKLTDAELGVLVA